MKPARQEETVLELLMHEGLLDSASAVRIGARARDLGESPVEAAVASGAVKEEDIAIILSAHYSLPCIDATRYFIKREILNLMPMEFWETNRLLPLDKIGDIIIVVICDVLPHGVRDEIEAATNCKIAAYVTRHGSFAQAIHALKEQLQSKAQA